MAKSIYYFGQTEQEREDLTDILHDLKLLE